MKNSTITFILWFLAITTLLAGLVNIAQNSRIANLEQEVQTLKK